MEKMETTEGGMEVKARKMKFVDNENHILLACPSGL